VTTNGAGDGEVTTRCLIADDQAMVREGFAAVLDSQPGLLVVGQAADGADAVRQTRQLEPDVVLMDVRMPVLDGLAATRQILSAAGPARPRVLMLTTFDLDEYVYAALRAGASGFPLKDATAAELIHAVRVVAAGDALLAPSVTRRLIADGLARGARAARRTPAAPDHRLQEGRRATHHAQPPGQRRPAGRAPDRDHLGTARRPGITVLLHSPPISAPCSAARSRGRCTQATAVTAATHPTLAARSPS
jgi:DNA-binding NarL/FixJ family response regulator